MEKKIKLHPLMIAGTGSDVGKSVVATALCRIFLQDGYRPAPFKAQNMALNSYATSDGLEIGRAQAVQAEAAGVPCSTDMNPLLLKPNSEHTTQVVLNGKPIGNRSAYEYFRKEGRDVLRKEVHAAFDRLAACYNPIVMEGAGSISEINLKDTDLVNMPMARYANADVILVADIDRGGVFASAYGSIMLQDDADKKRIKGIIVNKFRGDMRLFDEGRTLMEKICGVPVLGVIPAFTDIDIDEEDSVSLEKKKREAAEGKVNIAVVLLRHISNFTDFSTLERMEGVNLFYTNNTDDLQRADIIILPGTKATMDDLSELRRNGVAQAIVRAFRKGKTIVGICGGYQMLGQTVSDPYGVEGSVAALPGLGILPVDTVMEMEKSTRQTRFRFLMDDGNLSASECLGYEIHQGVTNIVEDMDKYNSKADDDSKISCLNYLEHGGQEGYALGRRCFGTYMHGILDNPAFIYYLLSGVGKDVGVSTDMSLSEYKNLQYDKLAEHVRKHLDMERLYKILTD